MRYLVETRAGKDKYEKIIKDTFPHIQYADFETFIQKNKAGIIVFDREEFLKKLEKIRSLSEKEDLNFVIVVVSQGEVPKHDLPDVFVVPEFASKVMEEVKSRILDKMEKLTREKIKNIQRDELKEYESLGVGILIIDNEEKIVYANDLLLRFLKNKYSLEEILNLNVHKFLKEIAPDFDTKKLFTETRMSPRKIKIVLPDGTVEQKSISVTPRIRADNKIDGFIMRFHEPLTHEGERLLKEILDLVEEFQSIGEEVRAEFFIAIPRLLKKFAEILKVRSLLFVPFYIARIWGFEDEVPFILVYKTAKGEYLGRLIYGFKASEEDKKRCITNYRLENFMNIYREFDDVEEAKNVVGLAEFIRGRGKEIYGVLCLDRSELFDIRERLLIKSLIQRLRELIVNLSKIRLVNLIENFSQSHGKSGVVVMEKDGRVTYVSRGFSEIFNVPLDVVHDFSVETIPGLRDKPRVLETVFKFIKEDKPLRREIWIKLPNGEEKYLVISGFPAGEFNVPGYIWIFEDRTEEKLKELKESFFKDIFEANSKIARTVGVEWSGYKEYSTSEFYENLLKILVENLSEISDGLIATLVDPVSDNVFCQVGQNLPAILTEKELCRFVNALDEFLSQQVGLKDDSVTLVNLNKVSADSLVKAGFAWAIRIPILSELEKKEKIGTLIMLLKGHGKSFLLARAIYNPESYALESKDQNAFTQLAKTISGIVRAFRKDVILEENRKLLEEFYKHSHDLFILADEDGKIILANKTARELFCREDLEGNDLLSVLKNTFEGDINRLFDLKEEEEETGIITLKTCRGKKWVKLTVKKIKIGDIQEFIVIGHDVSVFYISKLTRNRAIIGLIAMLLNILAEKSAIVARHSINVAIIVKEILDVIKRENPFEGKFINNADRFCLITGALLHDIGKLNMATSYLIRPPEKLRKNSLVRKYYEEHPIVGAELLSNLGLPCDDKIPKWVMEHHEFLDGSGFPNKLEGDEISLGGKIIGVADRIENEIIRKPQRGGIEDLKTLLSNMKKSGKYDMKVLNIVEKVYEEKGGRFLLSLTSTEKYEKREADMREAADELLGPLLVEE